VITKSAVIHGCLRICCHASWQNFANFGPPVNLTTPVRTPSKFCPRGPVSTATQHYHGSERREEGGGRREEGGGRREEGGGRREQEEGGGRREGGGGGGGGRRRRRRRSRREKEGPLGSKKGPVSPVTR
jgi:hypothetical protein